jgi:hypothetical protein
MVFSAKGVFGPHAVVVVAGYGFFFLGVEAGVVSDEVGPACEDRATAFFLPAGFSWELTGVAALLRIPKNRRIC